MECLRLFVTLGAIAETDIPQTVKDRLCAEAVQEWVGDSCSIKEVREWFLKVARQMTGQAP
jgi:hypothetical protein